MECKTCVSWNKGENNRGQCRSQVPRAELIPVQGIGGQGLSVVTFWPETSANDWCGDYLVDEHEPVQQSALNLIQPA